MGAAVSRTVSALRSDHAPTVFAPTERTANDVNAVVLHHVGEIIRSGRTIHGDGIAVGVGAQIELHGVIIHTLHAGPRGLLAVPDGAVGAASTAGIAAVRSSVVWPKASFAAM